jgi:hypothetical protein
VADIFSMATTTTRAKRAGLKPRKAKPSARALSSAALLKLAAKHRPPQRWYDEQADPTKPKSSRRHEH